MTIQREACATNTNCSIRYKFLRFIWIRYVQIYCKKDNNKRRGPSPSAIYKACAVLEDIIVPPIRIYKPRPRESHSPGHKSRHIPIVIGEGLQKCQCLGNVPEAPFQYINVTRWP
jgi:hypothetical protein